MQISCEYVVVVKAEEERRDGFNVVEPTDSFVYKGKILNLPEGNVIYISNKRLEKGDVILFAKYSPDTIEIEHEGTKMKFVKQTDILAVL